MANHNFGECRECGCLTTRLMDVTNLSTGEKSKRICCILHPGDHWRPARMEDIRLELESRRAGEATVDEMDSIRGPGLAEAPYDTPIPDPRAW